MEEKNVKIKIYEVDNTTPGGAPTDSSDIVFVPGFLGNDYDPTKVAPDNVPCLYTTVESFEAAVGKTPKILTSEDVEGYTGFFEGDYDKSYIYAKELLYAGMPVVYSVITNIKKQAKPGVYTFPEGMPLFSDLVGDASERVFNGTFKHDTGNYTSIRIAYEHIDNTEHKKIYYGDSAEPVYRNGWIQSPEIEVIKDDSGELMELFELLKPSSTVDNTSSCIESLYTRLEDQLKMLEDRNEYSVKYITSGGYPSIRNSGETVTGVFSDMLATAAKRGDAVALLDYELNTDDTFFGDNGIYTRLSKTTFTDGSYGTAMYPWGVYSCSASLSRYVLKNEDATVEVIMPPSFGYMLCVAHAIKTSPNWLAMAGVTRGLVPNLLRLVTAEPLTNTIAEEMQPKYGVENNKLSINCITNVRPYGLTLWGNRTLKEMGKDGAVALNFLNIRNMISDIKKLLYSTAKSLMFEQDSDSLWLRFKSGVSPLLNQLKSGNGIADYKIIRTYTRADGSRLSNGEIAATIRIFPLYAIEYFELTVEINDNDVSVS